MILRCPHCDKRADHLRSDVFGDWVVCPKCELPFAWKEAEDSERSEARNGNGARPSQTEAKTQ